MSNFNVVIKLRQIKKVNMLLNSPLMHHAYKKGRQVMHMTYFLKCFLHN